MLKEDKHASQHHFDFKSCNDIFPAKVEELQARLKATREAAIKKLKIERSSALRKPADEK